eukprot:3975580-Alexandrium_andersonii.AAC.1
MATAGVQAPGFAWAARKFEEDGDPWAPAMQELARKAAAGLAAHRARRPASGERARGQPKGAIATADR